jgi:hypothetical protein
MEQGGGNTWAFELERRARRRTRRRKHLLDLFYCII